MNIKKEMSREFAKKDDNKPTHWVNFIHQAKGDEELAKKMARDHDNRRES